MNYPEGSRSQRCRHRKRDYPGQNDFGDDALVSRPGDRADPEKRSNRDMCRRHGQAQVAGEDDENSCYQVCGESLAVVPVLWVIQFFFNFSVKYCYQWNRYYGQGFTIGTPGIFEANL